MPLLSTYPLAVNMSAVNVIAIVTRYLSFAADFIVIIIIIWYHISRKITSKIIKLFVITSSQSSPCLVHQSTPITAGLPTHDGHGHASRDAAGDVVGSAPLGGSGPHPTLVSRASTVRTICARQCRSPPPSFQYARPWPLRWHAPSHSNLHWHGHTRCEPA